MTFAASSPLLSSELGRCTRSLPAPLIRLSTSLGEAEIFAPHRLQDRERFTTLEAAVNKGRSWKLSAAGNSRNARNALDGNLP
jgi:hypothetical protein